ncbi:hypothetical protein K0U07_05010 [bacterium]|nr:hypothetical protein [bacterium]
MEVCADNQRGARGPVFASIRNKGVEVVAYTAFAGIFLATVPLFVATNKRMCTFIFATAWSVGEYVSPTLAFVVGGFLFLAAWFFKLPDTLDTWEALKGRLCCIR